MVSHFAFVMVKRKRTSEKEYIPRKRGYVLPGYNYLGPGNDLNGGKPTNSSDAAARRHDIAYGEYEKKGHNPYLKWNQADQRFIDQASWKDYGGFLGKSFFYAKKAASRIGVVDTIKEGSFSNLTSASNMPLNGGGTGSGMTENSNETPVDEVVHVTRGPAPYAFSSLPFLRKRTHMGEQYHTYKYLWRMTSPYDCEHETTLIDTNAGAGAQNERTQSVTDVTQRQARWFDFYAGIYNFYHVVSCRYEVMVENLSTEAMWVHSLFCNDDEPPSGATNDDIQLWAGTRSNYLAPIGYAILATGWAEDEDDATATGMTIDDETAATGTGANYETGNHVTPRGPSNICKFSGEYRPGDFTREIHLDDQVEKWTSVSTNPSLPERLCVLIRPDTEFTQENGAVNSNRPINYRLNIKLEYLVEFKELKPGLRYPVNRQPLTVTINQNKTSGV